MQLAKTDQSINFSYSQSWIGNLPIAFSTSLSFAHAKANTPVNAFTPNLELNQNNYTMAYHDYSATLSSGLARRWTPDYAIISLAGGISTSLKINQFDETNNVPVDTSVALYANRLGISNSLYASFAVDNRDNNYDPTKGWYLNERLSWYGLIPGLEKEFYARSDTKLEGYFKLFDIPFTEKWSLKLILAGYTGLSAIIPAGSGISEKNSIYLDGMLNGRGWQDAYKNTTGLAMLSNKLELRIPIVPGIVGIDGFWDAAVVKPTLNEIIQIKPEDWYFSFGPGIRVLLPQIPLHLMFAWRYRIVDGQPKFADQPYNFVLSFNVVNN